MLNLVADLFGYVMKIMCDFIQNYGIAVILFTILVKLMLIPLTLKQQKSLEKSQQLQPKIAELQSKYGKDQQKFAEEYQKLLKENNTSMLGSSGCSGCLLTFIQLPIILAVFYMMASPLSHIIKMDESLIEEYKNELNDSRKAQQIEYIESHSGEYTSEDYAKYLKNAEEATYINPTYCEIEIIKEKNLMDMEFLGINLGDVAASNKDKPVLLIIPVLSGLFTALTFVISNYINKKKGVVRPKAEDQEIPMPDMRVMNIMMPIMIASLAYSVPQSVGLYWAVSNFLGIIQTIVMNRKVFMKENKMLTAGSKKK